MDTTIQRRRYAGLFRTYSDFLSRMRDIIKGNGGCVWRSYDCALIHAQKA
jgi:hypothetical protein